MNTGIKEIKTAEERTPVEWMQAAINALRLELDSSIVDDVQKRWDEAKEYLNQWDESKGEETEKPIILIDEVLSILNENYEACKNLTGEDKARSAQETVNETYEDLIAIFNHKRNINGTI